MRCKTCGNQQLDEGDAVSRLTDLIAEAKAKDPQMGTDLEREVRVLSARLPFGINFERHGDDVRVAFAGRWLAQQYAEAL